MYSGVYKNRGAGKRVSEVTRLKRILGLMAKANRQKEPQNDAPASVTGSSGKGEPATLTPLNFKVPEKFHREFKTYAAQHGVSMLELLQEGFRLVKERRRE
jgi:hypothetical protein